jgi:hypothetical protein
METALSSPDLDRDDGGTEALRVLKAMRNHLGEVVVDLNVQLPDDLDEVLAVVEGS